MNNKPHMSQGSGALTISGYKAVRNRNNNCSFFTVY
jgi:hypothetical protein